MKNFKRVWLYFKDQKFFIFVALLASGFVSATDGATAYIVKDILDGIFINKDESMLKFIPLAIIIIYGFRLIARIIQSYFIQYAGQKAVQLVREDLYHKMILLPMSYFDTNSTGTMMARIINDVTNLQNAVPAALKIFRSFLSIFFLIGVVLYQDIKLGSTIFIAIPVMALVIDKTGRKIKKYSKKQQEKIGALSAGLQETLSGITVVKSFATEEEEIGRFVKINAKEVGYRIKQVMITSFSSPFLETIAGFGIAVIIFYGGLKVITGDTTAGTFFSFLTAFGLMFDPFKKINIYNSTVQAANASAERIFSILDMKNSIMDNDGTLDCNAHGQDITLENLSFRYNDDDGDVIKGLNLTIKAGSTVALVGASGAGKSTIASLLPRFYDVTGGSIKIGETDIRDFKVNSLRKNIGIVSQDPFLFDISVKENISYGASGVKDEDITKAAESAFALDFINELPEGFDTVLGERGDRLSGGQKQRITIARAILSNPPIMILDEATSALDTQSERIVQDALSNLMKGRTSIVIAHRLSTIVNADMIVVMNKGQIEATGTHAELLEISSTYAKLCKMQKLDEN